MKKPGMEYVKLTGFERHVDSRDISRNTPVRTSVKSAVGTWNHCISARVEILFSKSVRARNDRNAVGCSRISEVQLYRTVSAQRGTFQESPVIVLMPAKAAVSRRYREDVASP